MKTDKDFLEGIYEKARALDSLRLEIENNEGSFTGDQNNKEIKIMEFNETQKMLKMTPAPKRRITLVRCMIAAAAAFAVVATGNLYLNRSIPMEIPLGYQELAGGTNENENENENENGRSALLQAAPMMAMGLNSPVVDAAVICTAKVGRIDKSVYDEETQSFTTAVLLKPIEIIKGEDQEAFTLTIAGGYDDKAKTCQEYQEVFEVREEVLVFLQRAEPADVAVSSSSYILLESAGGKYTKTQESDSYQNSTGAIYTTDSIKVELVATSVVVTPVDQASSGE